MNAIERFTHEEAAPVFTRAHVTCDSQNSFGAGEVLPRGES